MKLKVNRQLSGGLYNVDFTVSDFTPDELIKMGSFGVPTIILAQGVGGGRQQYRVAITQIAPNYRASFATEEEAKAYEQRVVTSIRETMKAIRERTDDFSSTQEVDV